jgi:hypothetical protein
MSSVSNRLVALGDEMPDMATVAANMHLAEATGISKHHKIIPLFTTEEFVSSQQLAGKLRDSYSGVA